MNAQHRKEHALACLLRPATVSGSVCRVRRLPFQAHAFDRPAVVPVVEEPATEEEGYVEPEAEEPGYAGPVAVAF